MTPTEHTMLQRIEDKLDDMAEKVTTLVVKEDTMAGTVSRHTTEIESLKAAYNKALGVTAFLGLPGMGTVIWLGFQLYTKQP